MFSKQECFFLYKIILCDDKESCDGTIIDLFTQITNF